MRQQIIAVARRQRLHLAHPNPPIVQSSEVSSLAPVGLDAIDSAQAP